MCTALSFCRFFGRNLDLEKSYGEEVSLLGRRFPFLFREVSPLKQHYALIGMAAVREGMPLFFDAVNEHGIAMAGLNFPGNAHYHPLCNAKDNIAPFELIPWVLGSCQNLKEVKALLHRINIAEIGFSPTLPPTPLHWMIATPEGDLVVESTANGVEIFENTVGVLTNNPPFGQQLIGLDRHKYLHNQSPSSKIVTDSPHSFHSLGLGALGLPGDYSSMSRFARGYFLREFAQRDFESKEEQVEQFFHLLSALSVPKGCLKTPSGEDHYTRYSSGMDLEQCVYYYTTYFHSRITAIPLSHADLESAELYRFPLEKGNSIAVLGGADFFF